MEAFRTPVATPPTRLRQWFKTGLIGASLLLGSLGWAQAQSASAIPAGPLVSTEWLASNLTHPDIRIIEVSVNPGLYERAHIPGAVNFSWHNDLNDRVRRDIVTQKNFETLLSTAGVKPNTTVMLYGDTNNWFSAWAAWVFDIYGTPNVKLLDGGRKKWEAENRPLDNRVPQYAATQYKVPQVNTELRAGHIPTAVNVPWGQAVREDGTFKSPDELRRVYAAVGVDGSQPIITYCRIGERSSHTWFALSKILGYQVRNYDGSWTEYGNAVGVPVNNPAGTIWAAK
ncbi:MAG: putative thiosulfate sulfurtransferase [Paracidovorax wautersii]|uniref:Sulfurtransferase n=1 Tax=Paracidovorax wautersii TaxID=1177982 RepID=A0A7V8FLA3_9BURK|nr:MAG: putative thiosulfate sulfurtransferase [Paracidovorax wautersii]